MASSSRKRKADDGIKTKNSKPKNPRGKAAALIGQALSGLDSARESSTAMIFQMMQQQQQQQQQQAAQMQMQMQMQMMMGVMTAFGNRAPGINFPNFATNFATPGSNTAHPSRQAGNYGLGGAFMSPNENDLQAAPSNGSPGSLLEEQEDIYNKYYISIARYYILPRIPTQ